MGRHLWPSRLRFTAVHRSRRFPSYSQLATLHIEDLHSRIKKTFPEADNRFAQAGYKSCEGGLMAKEAIRDANIASIE